MKTIYKGLSYDFVFEIPEYNGSFSGAYVVFAQNGVGIYKIDFNAEEVFGNKIEVTLTGEQTDAFSHKMPVSAQVVYTYSYSGVAHTKATEVQTYRVHRTLPYTDPVVGGANNE